MKKKVVLCMTVLSLVASIVGCGKSDKPEETTAATTTATTEAVQETESEPEETRPSESVVESEPTEASSEPAETPEHRTGEEIIGISEKDIADVDVLFYDSVINDVTGNWRVAVVSSNIDILDYALSYYKTYFKDDSEIHGVVNLALNTTTKISYSGGILFISQYDYVDGEEHDAKIMFSGTYLGQDWVYTDNGDIEKVE